LIRFVAERAPEVEVILLSDYGKGVVTRPLLSAVLSAAATRNVPVIADPKGRDFSRYAGVTLLTPNRKEAGEAAGRDVGEAADLLAAGRTLLETSGVKNLLVTCGPEGMVLFERDRDPHLISAEARAVFDVSGAGDTVAAVLGLGVAAGLPLPEAAALANTAAGIVVGKVGTATLTRRELSDALRPSGDPLAAKLRTLDEIGETVRSLRQAGKKVVLTNGCFDLLHAGHIRLFSASRALGDALIVALDDDESVRRVKGDGRPVLRAEERVRVLGALDSVDFLVVFASDDLERLIETVRPDVLTKGGNYAPDAVRGHALVEKLGGRVERISVVEAVSATGIINAIRNG
jgi:D-beta-D-heptose 7-phosphate kinase/D-beta-D-heptose 1-phosphate adenosyltransferase